MNESKGTLMPNLHTGTSTTALPTDMSRLATTESLSQKSMFLIALYVIIFILGVTGNTSVITFFTRKSNRTLYDTYLIHLAVADLIVSLISPPRAICTIIIKSSFLNIDGCRALSAIEPVSVNASSWILTSIALERYRGIVQPLKPRYRRYYIHTGVLIIWLISFVYFLPYIHSINVVGKHCIPQWDSPEGQLAFNAVVLLVQSALPILIMCYTLLSICQVMRKRRKANLGRSQRGHRKNTNLIVVLAAASLVFTLCTLPYNIFYLVIVYDIGIMGRYEKLDEYIIWNDWLATLVLVSSVTNCCVYAGLHKEFKKFCVKCMRRRRAAGKKSSNNPLLTMSSKKKQRSSSNTTSNHATKGSALKQ